MSIVSGSSNRRVRGLGDLWAAAFQQQPPPGRAVHHRRSYGGREHDECGGASGARGTQGCRARPGGRGARPGQALPQGAGERRRRRVVRRHPGRGVRAAGAERGRQDDHRRDPHHPGAAHRRGGQGGWGGCGRRPGAGPATGRGRAPAQQPRPVPVDPPEPAVPCRLPRRADRRADPPGRCAAGRVRAGWAGRRQAGHVLRRPGPAGHGGQGAHARAQGAVHGRADHRPGPGGAPVRLGPGR